MQKKDIDSMMYIEENLLKITISLRKEYVDRIRDHFYINCCVVVDDFLDKNKILNSKEQKTRSEWKENRKDIKQIYMREIKIRLIDNGRLRPSKSLQDCLVSMLNGNQEFLMIDDQKLVYEKALEMGRKSYRDGRKRVLVVEGGPGTGKSVLAINLLVKMTPRDAVCAYVTKNAAPRCIF